MNTPNDVLDNLLQTLRLRTTVFHRGTFCGAWALDTSGSGRAAFHLVLDGRCWLHLPSLPAPEQLHPGDLLLFPRDAPHSISSDLCMSAPVNQSASIPLDVPAPTPGTALVCGHFEFAARGTNALLNALPDYVVFRTPKTETEGWPQAILQRIFAEARSDQPARSVMIERLVDLLFLEAIRGYLADRPQSTGLFAALRDPALRRALDAMHADVERAWTVDDLAAVAAMSRSAFASRFQAVLGQTPVGYLTAWRMKLAVDWLQEGSSVLDVALRCGYQTEAAFHRAFKREIGLTPGAVRRAAATAGPMPVAAAAVASDR
ncbi:MAG TPA: AraC family transcriptional regulator [Burkholderiaceae bacterium]|nr:AraC family transcriptional regulator [Burkholderiaceae bacterium]